MTNQKYVWELAPIIRGGSGSSGRSVPRFTHSQNLYKDEVNSSRYKAQELKIWWHRSTFSSVLLLYPLSSCQPRQGESTKIFWGLAEAGETPCPILPLGWWVLAKTGQILTWNLPKILANLAFSPAQANWTVMEQFCKASPQHLTRGSPSSTMAPDSTLLTKVCHPQDLRLCHNHHDDPHFLYFVSNIHFNQGMTYLVSLKYKFDQTAKFSLVLFPWGFHQFLVLPFFILRFPCTLQRLFWTRAWERLTWKIVPFLFFHLYHW